MSNLIKIAASLAKHAHKGQTRIYPEPYIVHPMRVAGRVTLLSHATEEMICAAWLHDVLEDTKLEAGIIEAALGGDIVGMVIGLTNPKRENMTREQKKTLDRNRLKATPWEVKVIKMADRIDNMRDCVYHAELVHKLRPNLAANYLEESKLLLPCIQVEGHELVDEYSMWLERMAQGFSKSS